MTRSQRVPCAQCAVNTASLLVVWHGCQLWMQQLRKASKLRMMQLLLRTSRAL